MPVTPRAGDDATAAHASEAAVAVLFGERADLARAFAVHLGTTAVERGLIGPRELPRIWDRHILNCAAVTVLVPERARVADVGSGAGLPGLVLAIARPDLEMTLVEPLQRRVAWLTEVVTDLGLLNVRVFRGRAEEFELGPELTGEGSAAGPGFDLVTARAVAPLALLSLWCLPLLRPGGVLLALKGQSAAEELSSAAGALRRLGAGHWSVEVCGEGLLEVPTTVVRIERDSAELSSARKGLDGSRGRARARRGRGPNGGTRGGC